MREYEDEDLENATKKGTTGPVQREFGPQRPSYSLGVALMEVFVGVRMLCGFWDYCSFLWWRAHSLGKNTFSTSVVETQLALSLTDEKQHTFVSTSSWMLLIATSKFFVSLDLQVTSRHVWSGCVSSGELLFQSNDSALGSNYKTLFFWTFMLSRFWQKLLFGCVKGPGHWHRIKTSAAISSIARFSWNI